MVASLVAEHRLQVNRLQFTLQSAWRLTSCGARAFVVPRHVESSQARGQTCVPALAGRFLSTVPPGKSLLIFLAIPDSGMWDLSSPNRDQTLSPCSTSTES